MGFDGALFLTMEHKFHGTLVCNPNLLERVVFRQKKTIFKLIKQNEKGPHARSFDVFSS